MIDKTEEKKQQTETDTKATVQSKEEEYLNNWKKERADFLNYKKDEAKRLEEFVRFANEDLIIETIEVLDDLKIARENAPPGNSEWLQGFDNAIRKFDDLFRKYGVDKIEVENSKFDPSVHEAVAVSSEASGEGREMQEGGQKLEEVRAGYIMRGKVIRSAKVKIIK